jgi:hypothetical protein
MRDWTQQDEGPGRNATGLAARHLSAPTARETRGPYNPVPPAQIKSGVLPIGIRATRQMG